MKKVGLDISLLNRQTTTFRLYFLREIVLAHFQGIFVKGNRVYSEKMKAKCMKEDLRKSFFCYLAGWHLTTSL